MVASTGPHPGGLALCITSYLDLALALGLALPIDVVEVTWHHFWHEGSLVASSVCVSGDQYPNRAHTRWETSPHQGRPPLTSEPPWECSPQPVGPPLLKRGGQTNHRLVFPPRKDICCS